MEKSRKRLELLRSQPLGTSAVFSHLNDGPWVDLKKLFCSRSLPTRYKDFPESPFMVSAVFEDLKFRWNKKNISEAVSSTLSASLNDFEDYPWASITVMVPGEADAECARIARRSGCAILTNDSDLLVYNLGTHGSVVFFNSIEIDGWSCDDSGESAEIKAMRLCPAWLSLRLGIVNVQHYAYELNRAPHLGQTELIQRSRSTSEETSEYRLFTKEYQIGPCYGPMQDVLQWPAQPLDTRLSEIYWQYGIHGIFMSGEAPHVYLGNLNEDHAKKCAWEQGRMYRSLGYSIFNAHLSVPRRFTSIYEYVRRGGRIAAVRTTLGDSEWIEAEMEYVCEHLGMAQATFHDHSASPTFWRAFALCEVYNARVMQDCLPDAGQLRRFFRLGHMGEKLEWSDIHLFAETRALLYSLRMLKQLLGASDYHGGLAAKLTTILSGLPSLHILMRSRHEITREYSNYIADGFEDRFFCLWEQMLGARPCQVQSSVKQLPHGSTGSTGSSKLVPVKQGAGCYEGHQRSSNIYEFLTLS
ncbi:hypothetical protein PHISCL_07470 [Aspergillus sclerotialis]|uniref:Asteroid domain-containing protein n=1 Tax=Aspergillus sclerotialis TaxID=2070753 RepID=A0A3A2ZT79_9EURO|nr:hypothetical protein PHISCL_07470 [Aspergillus sclerotialis]